jgi:hypothetical protein
MANYSAPKIIDCDCKRRYMRTAIQTTSFEIGHFRCACGNVLESWRGEYRLMFEAEDAPPDLNGGSA